MCTRAGEKCYRSKHHRKLLRITNTYGNNNNHNNIGLKMRTQQFAQNTLKEIETGAKRRVREIVNTVCGNDDGILVMLSFCARAH